MFAGPDMNVQEVLTMYRDL